MYSINGIQVETLRVADALLVCGLFFILKFFRSDDKCIRIKITTEGWMVAPTGGRGGGDNDKRERGGRFERWVRERERVYRVVMLFVFIVVVIRYRYGFFKERTFCMIYDIDASSEN